MSDHLRRYRATREALTQDYPQGRASTLGILP